VTVAVEGELEPDCNEIKESVTASVSTTCDVIATD
jgi:hypothetical protein